MQSGKNVDTSQLHIINNQFEHQRIGALRLGGEGKWHDYRIIGNYINGQASDDFSSSGRNAYGLSVQNLQMGIILGNTFRGVGVGIILEKGYGSLIGVNRFIDCNTPIKVLQTGGVVVGDLNQSTACANNVQDLRSFPSQ